MLNAVIVRTQIEPFQSIVIKLVNDIVANATLNIRIWYSHILLILFAIHLVYFLITEVVVFGIPSNKWKSPYTEIAPKMIKDMPH
jgi:hypothetical protein